MKEFIVENIETEITVCTMVVTWLCGILAKKNKHILNSRIPIQNILIAVLMTLIYWWATGDLSITVASGSPIATLIYDAIHSIKKEG